MAKRKGMVTGHLEGWLRFSLLAHLIWLVLFAFLVWVGPSHSLLPTPERLLECKTCTQTSDAIKSAAELGRLDFISISLTFLGVALAIGAIVSYGYVKGAAQDAASDTAVMETESWLEANKGAFTNELAKTLTPTLLEKLRPEVIDRLFNDDRYVLILAKEVQKRIYDEKLEGKPTAADDIAGSME